MPLSTYITNDEIAVLIVYLVSLTGGLIWALYRIYVLEKREKLWRELVIYNDLLWKEPIGNKYHTDVYKKRILELKQQLGYDN